MKLQIGPVCPETLTTEVQIGDCVYIGTLVERKPMLYGYRLAVELHDGSPLLFLREEINSEGKRRKPVYDT